MRPRVLTLALLAVLAVPAFAAAHEGRACEAEPANLTLHTPAGSVYQTKRELYQESNGLAGLQRGADGCTPDTKVL